MIAVLIQQMVLVSSVLFSELFDYAPNIYFQEICCSYYNWFSATNCQYIINKCSECFSHAKTCLTYKCNSRECNDIPFTCCYDRSECLAGITPRFPQIDIIGAMLIVWRVRGKIIRSVLCNIVRNNCAQCNAHTWTVLWIRFCLTGSISLCFDSFLCMYVFSVCLYIACMCSIVTWWCGPGGIEAYP